MLIGKPGGNLTSMNSRSLLKCLNGARASSMFKSEFVVNGKFSLCKEKGNDLKV